jgi:V/A-type H+-transporting ATPase subunit C
VRPRFRFDIQYSYAVGRIRVLEKRFITKQILDRLFVSSSPQEMGRILSEMGYRSEFANVRSWREIEHWMEKEWNTTLDLVTRLNIDPFLTDLFRKRVDYHNLKVLLKSHLTEETREDLLREGGVVPADTVKETILSEKVETLPPFLERALRGVRETIGESDDPVVVDQIIDGFEAKEWDSELRLHPNLFILGWWSLKVDLVNLTILLRVKHMNENQSDISKAFWSGGGLDFDTLFSLIEQPWEVIYRALAKTEYDEMVIQAVRDLEDGKGFLEWERMCENMMWRYIQVARQFAFGLEVLFAFLLTKEMELSVVRRILVGRANTLSKETIEIGVSDAFL